MKKRMIKIISTICIMTLLLNSVPFVVNATEYDANQGITTYLVNCNRCTCMFNVTQEGMADVGVTYYAKDDVFTYAKLTVKIQKRVLGLFWSTVDIGESNNEWVVYCYDVYGNFYNSFPLESTGTYRAVFTVEFYGTSGEVDVIEDTIESAYE